MIIIFDYCTTIVLCYPLLFGQKDGFDDRCWHVHNYFWLVLDLCMRNDVIYNDLMLKGENYNKSSEVVGNGLWRGEQISIFYELKEKL